VAADFDRSLMVAAILMNKARPRQVIGDLRGSSLCLEINDVLLSPRETKQYIISCYEREWGRKLSKKEGNLAMQEVRNALGTVIESEERLITDSQGNRILLSGPMLTWKKDAKADC